MFFFFNQRVYATQKLQFKIYASLLSIFCFAFRLKLMNEHVDNLYSGSRKQLCEARQRNIITHGLVHQAPQDELRWEEDTAECNASVCDDNRLKKSQKTHGCRGSSWRRMFGRLLVFIEGMMIKAKKKGRKRGRETENKSHRGIVTQAQRK